MRRSLLPTVLLAAAFLAGCAQTGDTPEGGSDTPLTATQAMDVFTQSAANLPDRYAMEMRAEKAGATLISADALYDEPAGTMFLHLQMDPALMEDAQSEGGEGMMPDLSDVTVYTSPEGSAVLMDESTVMLAPPADTLKQMAGGADGMDTISDPGSFFSEMQTDGLNITSVSPDTLRGKPATKVEATVEEDGARVPVTIWLFQEPARIARVVATAPSMPAEGEEDDPFAGATMTIDMLYDGDIDMEVPASLTRALGLRYSGGGMGMDFGGGSSDEGPTVWTFEVDGGIPLADITLELDGEPLLKLSDLNAESDGVTATYDDADGDGKVSAGDTLTIDGASGELALHDSVTGLRVVPGAGLLLAALALAGVALLARRR